VIAFALPESDFGLRAVQQLNDGDIVDYIMLCAGVPVTGGCKEN
jgi:hypothetical protein